MANIPISGVQLSLFSDPKQVKRQKKLLLQLIALKAAEIQEDEFHNFFGTAEKIQEKRAIINQKIVRFTESVRKAFPGMLDDSDFHSIENI